MQGIHPATRAFLFRKRVWKMPAKRKSFFQRGDRTDHLVHGTLLQALSIAHRPRWLFLSLVHHRRPLYQYVNHGFARFFLALRSFFFSLIGGMEAKHSGTWLLFGGVRSLSGEETGRGVVPQCWGFDRKRRTGGNEVGLLRLLVVPPGLVACSSRLL